jgi:hypothetical protein
MARLIVPLVLQTGRLTSTTCTAGHSHKIFTPDLDTKDCSDLEPKHNYAYFTGSLRRKTTNHLFYTGTPLAIEHDSFRPSQRGSSTTTVIDGSISKSFGLDKVTSLHKPPPPARCTFFNALMLLPHQIFSCRAAAGSEWISPSGL